MDFLDPKKQRRHMIQLLVGYVLIGVAILIGTTILLYQAYGFGLDKDGEIIQNGLVFVSSQPNSGEIYVNGVLKKDRTNAKLQLPAGDYALEIRRDGYRNWQRDIKLEGGVIEHFNYPLLFPSTMTQAKVKDYTTPPGLVTQSPDRRWLLVQQAGSVVNFDVFDLNDPQNLAADAVVLTVPESTLTLPAAAGQAWKLVEWSTDNRRVLLERTYAGGVEYILVDRDDPPSSVNLTRTLQLAAGQTVTLRDKKFDKYYIFDAAAKQLTTVTLGQPTVKVPVLTGVLAFKSYADDKILYATADGAPAGKVLTMLLEGDITYKLREHGPQGPYLMDMARFDGNWYVVVGASGDNKAYVYKNPQAVRRSGKVEVLVPVHILKATAPTYLAFSSNTQYVMIENGTSFATYDADTGRGYAYTTAVPLDAPATHATWMDGHRLSYFSGGKLVVFDYDYKNSQTLVAGNAAYLPYFDRDYEFMYTMTPSATAGLAVLSSSSLLAEQDQ